MIYKRLYGISKRQLVELARLGKVKAKALSSCWGISYEVMWEGSAENWISYCASK